MKIKFAKPLAGIICAAVLVAGSAGLTAYSPRLRQKYGEHRKE